MTDPNTNPNTVLEYAQPADAGFDASRIDAIRSSAPQWLERGRARSLVLLLARRGRIALHEAWGPQSFDDPEPLDRNAMFSVASVSKPVTATLIMQLVEDGLLSLNRPVRDYLPEMSGEHTERMLVHQLLTHTSGLSEAFPPVYMQPPPTDVPCPDGLTPFGHRTLQAIFAMDCHKPPGKQNMYATENFVLLGEIIRRVTGDDIEAVARARLFGPLGMSNSTFSRPPDAASMCRPDPSSWPFSSQLDDMLATPNAGGSMKSSALELARFGQLFLNGGSYDGRRFLNPWTVAEMTRNQIPGIGAVTQLGTWIPEGCWGLGWMVQGDARWPFSHGMLQPRGTYYHQGGSGCSIWVDPVHELVGVYLSVLCEMRGRADPLWEFDTFQNMATAAITNREQV